LRWFDASIGKSLAAGEIDIPVKSWGIFLGVLGDQQKHIILAQNGFRYSDGLWDVDYTAIPLVWSTKIEEIHQGQVSEAEAQQLLKSFLQGRQRTLKRRVSNHDRHN
jgi:hypothetical protein